MLSTVRNLLGGAKTAPRSPRTRRLMCETLEDRLAPALVGSELHVNTTTRNNQNQAATATSNNGTSVVVFTHTFSSTDRDIHAQRYDRFGNRMGGEFVVTNAFADEHEPSVAMNDQGDILVAWTQGTGTARDVRATKILANGGRVGPFTVVGTSRAEHDSSVGMAANGSFVVSYTRDWTATDPDILARQFSSTGTFLREIVVANPTRPDRASSVAMSPDGRFGIAYETQLGFLNNYLLVNRFNSSGGLMSSNFIDPYGNNSHNASLSSDRNFNLVVAYQALYSNSGYDIYARRLYSDGNLSGHFAVRSQSTLNETNPSVALHPTNGRFVVTYNVQTRNSPLTTVIQGTEVSADNTIFSNFSLGGLRFNSSVTINSDGRYLIAYTSAPPTQSSALDPLDGIYAQRGQL